MRVGSWAWESYLTDQKLTMLWGAEGMGALDGLKLCLSKLRGEKISFVLSLGRGKSVEWRRGVLGGLRRRDQWANPHVRESLRGWCVVEI